MCSIFAILNIQSDIKTLRPKALKLSGKMRHRGPDWSGSWHNEQAILVHERLAIVDMENGSQPLLNKKQNHILAVNGEIYNHQQLAAELMHKNPGNPQYEFQTGSDCEIILALYQSFKQQKSLGFEYFIGQLSGMFSFILYDTELDQYIIARDPFGIIPLYYGFDECGQVYIASEMKALVKDCPIIDNFPPGSFIQCFSHSRPKSIDDMGLKKYVQPTWAKNETFTPKAITPAMIRASLESSVKSHLMSDVPYGVLLSGGLDSSIIAAITQKYSQKRIENADKTPAWWPQLHSFAIGLEHSPDLDAADKVADALGTIHHRLTFSVQDGLDALREVIYHIETYDVTTIRASTPMYLLARKIKAMGIKMVLSGEGADEIFGGYLYFHKAPNPQQFH